MSNEPGSQAIQNASVGLRQAASQGDESMARFWIGKLRELLPQDELDARISRAARVACAFGQPGALPCMLPLLPQPARALEEMDPLMAAASHKSLACLEVLTPWFSGASTFKGQNALGMAIEADARECAMALAQGEGALSPEPLFEAAKRDWGNLCAALASRGHAGARNGFGDTALHVAASLGHREACEALIPFCDLDAPGGRGQSCARSAFENGHEALATMLRGVAQAQREARELAQAALPKQGQSSPAAPRL